MINYSCQLEQRFNEFSLLRALFRQLLRFDQNEYTQYDREQYLLRLFDTTKSNDLHLRRNLFLLNDLLDVRFRRSHIETETSINEKNFVRTYEMNINEVLLHILNQLLESSTNINEMSLKYVDGISRRETLEFILVPPIPNSESPRLPLPPVRSRLSRRSYSLSMIFISRMKVS